MPKNKQPRPNVHLLLIFAQGGGIETCRGESSWRVELELESGMLDDRVERVDHVEIFRLASRPHSSITYSGSSEEGPDTFALIPPSFAR